MRLSAEIKNQIIESLKPLDPFKVILFGSYAWGEPTKDSDIDIVFVDKNSGCFASFEDRINAKKEILKRLSSIDKPFDLINYSKEEWELLSKNPNQFIKKIERMGIAIE